ncbi:MAG: DNA polymerase I [Desulfuromonadales bacterium]|nr:DNA polymerase I [Desulfuromonadales bacterium]
MTTKTLYLIDGSSYIYRAYYAIRNLTSPSGFPVNALYGFTNMLLKVLRERNPDYVAVVFDASRITFRTEIYPEYKANRIAMPDDLRQQIEPIKEMVKAFNIPAIEMQGFEADDIIGTIAKRNAGEEMQIMVVTGDKDLMQIVTDNVRLLDTMKDKESGIAEVNERFGVGPDKVIDILGLAGDTSDNIPGVPGIGEKTAIKLIQDFGSLDQLLERTSEIKGKTGERLTEFAEQARLSRVLATINCDVPLEYELKDFSSSEPDNKHLAEIFKEYGFTSLMKELTSQATLTRENYKAITDKSSFNKLMTDMKRAESFAVDLETTSLNVLEAEIVGISVAFREHEAFYIPVGHISVSDKEETGLFAENVTGKKLLDGQLLLSEVLEELKPVLEEPGRRIIGQNLKYDYQVFRRYDITIASIWCDTMIAAYLNNPSRQSHGLDSLAIEYLDHKMMSYSDVVGKGKEQKNFAEVDIETATAYSCEDSDAAYLLHKILMPKVESKGMLPLFNDLEIPLVTILAEMELTGVKLDMRLLAEMSNSFGKKLISLEKQICDFAGEEFNINSPKQLGEILFVKLKLPVGKKTKTKTGWSTNVEELERLAGEGSEIAALLLEYRGIAKLKSTYTDALPKLTEKKGRVHTSYNQAVTSTGRLSSSEPNLQNIPVRTEGGRMIRHAFIAEKGCKIVSADYSQIELRVLAHLSQDRVFCDAFANDQDIHTRTASEVFGLFPEMVTQDMRRQAKTINFGVIYGQSAFSLAKQLGVARKVAEDFIDTYKARHSGAIAFLESCVKEAEEKGYVTTLLGRRLPIPDIGSSNFNIRSFAQRNAINYPIQGSAADIIKKAMVNIDARLKKEDIKSRLIMQVHDELVFEVPDDELLYMEQFIKSEMENAVKLTVQLKVDVNHGDNWSEAH